MANSVRAKVWNETGFDEGAAAEQIEPGQGIVRDGTGGFAVAGDGDLTKWVAREPRNPPRFDTNVDNPLNHTYEAGDNVEALGFLSHDQARCLVAYADVDGDATDDTYSEGDLLGWNANGYLEANPTEPVARVANDEEVTMSNGDDPAVVVVEFI